MTPTLDLHDMQPGNVHHTQLETIASRLRNNMSLDEAVREVLEATQQVGDPNWNWEREEEKIRGLGLSHIAKNPELAHTLPDNVRAAFTSMVEAGAAPKFKFVRGQGWMLLGAYSPPPTDAQPAAPHRRIRFVTRKELKVAEDPEILIEAILPREGIGVFYGPPKTHKTFVAFDMAMHLARGKPYRGKCVQRVAVVYCAFEGQFGFAKRMEAYTRHHRIGPEEDIPFHLMPIRLNLTKEVDELIAAARADGLTPGLVVLDTLNRSLVGSESKDVDMTAYLAAADKLREAFGCLVLIVHHSGLEGGRPRGHTSLTGAADVQLSIVRNGDVSTVTVEFMKDGPEGEQLHSRLAVVDVGFNKTSCVVEACEAPEPVKAPTKKAKVEDTLFDLMTQAETGLTSDMWQKRARLRLGEELSRHDFWKAKEDLLAAGRIALGENGVFHVSKG